MRIEQVIDDAGRRAAHCQCARVLGRCRQGARLAQQGRHLNVERGGKLVQCRKTGRLAPLLGLADDIDGHPGGRGEFDLRGAPTVA
jgi:hypothetical protein